MNCVWTLSVTRGRLRVSFKKVVMPEKPVHGKEVLSRRGTLYSIAALEGIGRKKKENFPLCYGNNHLKVSVKMNGKDNMIEWIVHTLEY